VRPELLVGADGHDVAVRLRDGELAFVRPPTDSFAAEMWLKRDGDGRTIDAAIATPPQGILCDGNGCIWHTTADLSVAATLRVGGLAEDCGRNFLVIAAFPARRECSAPHVIDLIAIRQKGVHAVWLYPYRVQTVREFRGVRPWTRPPPYTERGMRNHN